MAAASGPSIYVHAPATDEADDGQAQLLGVGQGPAGGGTARGNDSQACPGGLQGDVGADPSGAEQYLFLQYDAIECGPADHLVHGVVAADVFYLKDYSVRIAESGTVYAAGLTEGLGLGGHGLGQVQQLPAADGDVHSQGRLGGDFLLLELGKTQAAAASAGNYPLG